MTELYLGAKVVAKDGTVGHIEEIYDDYLNKKWYEKETETYYVCWVLEKAIRTNEGYEKYVHTQYTKEELLKVIGEK